MDVPRHQLSPGLPVFMARTMIFLLPALIVLGLPQVSPGGVTSRIITTWEAGEVPLDVEVSLDGRWVFMLTKGNVLIYSKDGRLEDRIPVAKVFDGIDISPKGDLLYLSSRKSKKVQIMAISFRADIDTSEAPFMGPAEAPVVVAVFSDFQ